MVDEIVQMTKLLRNNPLAAKARLRRATLYRQLGLLESAEADLIQLVAKAPSAEAYYQLALVHKQRRHDCEAAIKMLSKAVSLKPQYADALFERGNLLKIVGRDDAAILDRTEAIRLKPELASEFAHDMSDASIPDDWETRVMNLNARIKKRSDDLTLRTQLANLYLEIGDYERGFRCLDELLVLAPNNDSVLYGTGSYRETRRGNSIPCSVLQNTADGYESSCISARLPTKV